MVIQSNQHTQAPPHSPRRASWSMLGFRSFYNLPSSHIPPSPVILHLSPSLSILQLTLLFNLCVHMSRGSFFFFKPTCTDPGAMAASTPVSQLPPPRRGRPSPPFRSLPVHLPPPSLSPPAGVARTLTHSAAPFLSCIRRLLHLGASQPPSLLYLPLSSPLP